MRIDALCAVWFVGAIAAAAAATAPAPVAVYGGDGLTVIVTELSEQTATISGQIRRGDSSFPFTGKIAEENGAEVIRGTFTSGNTTFEFSSRQEAGSDVVTFTTGTATFRLRPTDVPQADGPPKPKPKNPFDEKDQKPDDKPGPAAPNPANLRLKLHTFRDVTMGGVVSHSVCLPEGWTSSGQTEWSAGELTYPQHRFKIESPDGARVQLMPAFTLSYTETNPVEGFAPIPPVGVPAPQDFPNWWVSALQQTGGVTNAVLIESQRLPKIEEMHARTARETGANDVGEQREVHLITLEYDDAGARRREEMQMLYVRHAPIENQNIRSQMWSVFTSFIVSAPADKFAAMKPQLYTIAGTIKATPQWWNLSQALLAELSRIRTEERWKEIRRRGEMIDKLTDEAYARYRKTNSTSDVAQHERIKTIYETDDFRDTDGSIVNLPMHYHHVFSDGKGNYVLSNNSHDKPGELWTAIPRMQ